MYQCGLLILVFLQAIHVIYEQHAGDLTRISQLATDRADERLKAKIDLDKTKIEPLEAELVRMHIVAKKLDEALASKETALAITESWRQKLPKTLAATEHQFNQMHRQFEEAKQIWWEEFIILADRLNKQRILPFILAYKLFTFQTFGEFINSYAKAQIKGAVTNALEMVHEDF